MSIKNSITSTSTTSTFCKVKGCVNGIYSVPWRKDFKPIPCRHCNPVEYAKECAVRLKESIAREKTMSEEELASASARYAKVLIILNINRGTKNTDILELFESADTDNPKIIVKPYILSRPKQGREAVIWFPGGQVQAAWYREALHDGEDLAKPGSTTRCYFMKYEDKLRYGMQIQKLKQAYRKSQETSE